MGTGEWSEVPDENGWNWPPRDQGAASPQPEPRREEPSGSWNAFATPARPESWAPAPPAPAAPPVPPVTPSPQNAQSESWYEPRTGDHRWRQSGDYAAYGDLPASPNYTPYPQPGPAGPPAYGQTAGIPRQGGSALARAGDGYPVSPRSVSAPPAFNSPTSGLPAPYNPPGRTALARRPATVAAPPDDEPEYRRAITYTIAWYGVPGLLYLAWALTLESSRRTFVLHNFTASLLWLFGAAVLSLLVATILSWAAREWRSLTVSFAATVIGAGIATVAHSLALGS